MKNIVLIGLPGSGKTTAGRLLSERVGWRFVDLDEEIEKIGGATVKEIYHRTGEHEFRKLESEIVFRVIEEQETIQKGGGADNHAAGAGLIIAAGGGVVLREENVSILRKNGFLVFLDRKPEDISRDIESESRPLFQDRSDSFPQMSQRRRPIYLKSADLVIDMSGGIEAALIDLTIVREVLAEPGYAVIGDPIGHSLSPMLHGILFAAQGIDAHYRAIHVPKDKLSAFTAAVRASDLKGFNVTIPHKQQIMPLLDELDPEAQLCGAVNTVVNRNGRLHGYNTDAEGFCSALSQSGHRFFKRNVVLIGTGGAARAIAVKAVLERAESLHIIARDIHKAEKLAGEITEFAEKKVEAIAELKATRQTVGRDSFREEMITTITFDELRGGGFFLERNRHDLLINATPLGMKGFPEDHARLDFLERLLPDNSLVCDLIYSPPETTLLRKARELGISTLNGMSMLIYQALRAQELFLDWTHSRSLDREQLFSAASEQLNKHFA